MYNMVGQAVMNIKLCSVGGMDVMVYVCILLPLVDKLIVHSSDSQPYRNDEQTRV